MNNNNGLLVGIGVLVLVGIGALLLLNYHPAAAPTGTTSNPSGSTTEAPAPSAPRVTTSPSVAVSNSTAIVTGNVVPNGAQTTYWYEYGTTSTPGSRTSAQAIGSGYVSVGAPAFISGLAPSTLYYFRLAAQNSYGTVYGDVFTFSTNTSPPPVGVPPTVHTDSATSVLRTSANLNGRVNPDGAPTIFWFEYGESSDLGIVSGFQSAGSGNASLNESVAASGLQPQTKYFYRIDAQNQYGTVTGAIVSFTTPGPGIPSAPAVSTSDATSVTGSSATLNGLVNPDGAQTTYWFEYSTDSLLGSIIGSGTPQKNAGSGTTAVSVSANINGLARNTTYYFRLVASNSQGTVRGDIVRFTTNR